MELLWVSVINGASVYFLLLSLKIGNLTKMGGRRSIVTQVIVILMEITNWSFNFSAFEPNDGNPTRFRGVAVNPNTVALSWRPSPFSCDVIGYRILYNNPLITTFKEVLGGNSSQIIISDLVDGIPITFSIAGFTSEVLLTYETRVTVETPSLDGKKSDYFHHIFSAKSLYLQLLFLTWTQFYTAENIAQNISAE